MLQKLIKRKRDLFPESRQKSQSSLALPLFWNGLLKYFIKLIDFLRVN